MHCSLPDFSNHGDSRKNTGLGCHALLQGIFPIQGSNPGLPHCRWILYHLSHQGSLTMHCYHLKSPLSHSLLKSRDITLPKKVLLNKAMVFPIVIYGCECWTIKQAERSRVDAFELCWRRLLRVPCTARRLNQSILKEISPEYSLEGLMLKLKLQYFGQLMRRTDSLAKTQILGKIEGRRRRG